MTVWQNIPWAGFAEAGSPRYEKVVKGPVRPGILSLALYFPYSGSLFTYCLMEIREEVGPPDENTQPENHAAHLTWTQRQGHIGLSVPGGSLWDHFLPTTFVLPRDTAEAGVQAAMARTE